MAEVEKAIDALTRDLQRSPSVGEIAERLGLEEIEVLEVLEANHNRRPLSLDRPASADDPEEAPSAEWIGENDAGYELVEGKAALDTALPGLDERERAVLRLRFVEDLTQSEIAARIGYSQMHVSRILRQTLRQIREQIEESQPSSAIEAKRTTR
jgi:RNA polymerase sigma-B factor